MFARNPAWIGQGNGSWLHANLLMHESDPAKGLGLIDEQRHGGY